MLEMVETRRNVVEGEERYDLFSSLLDAAQNEQDSGTALSDDELIGGSLMSQSISTFGKRFTRPPRKHVYISSCWT